VLNTLIYVKNEATSTKHRNEVDRIESDNECKMFM